MITNHTFGDLAQACLAVNLAYLALDRFRYRDAISSIITNSISLLEGMPEREQFERDMAWKNLNILKAESGPGAHSNPYYHLLFTWLFSKYIDRWTALLAVIISFAFIVFRSADAISPMPNSVLSGWWEWMLWAFLTITTASAAIFIRFGRNCVLKVSEIVRDNITHLSTQYMSNNKEAAERLLHFLENLNQRI